MRVTGVRTIAKYLQFISSNITTKSKNGHKFPLKMQKTQELRCLALVHQHLQPPYPPTCRQSVSDSIILDFAFPSWWQLNCKAMTLRFQNI